MTCEGLPERGRAAALRVALAAALILLAALAAPTAGAAAGSSVTPTRTFAIGTFSPGDYAPGFDGTFWTVMTAGANKGFVGHLDDEGHNLGDGFEISYGGFYPLSIGYFDGRVLISLGSSSTARIASFNVATGGNLITPDLETNQRLGSNQRIIRTFPGGLMTAALGQDNKIGTLNAASSPSESPWYPQAYHGVGINASYNPDGNAFESCVLSGSGTYVGSPDNCGTHSGYYSSPNHLNGFNYPNDIAPGLGGLYVSEYLGDRVTHVDTVSNPGGVIDFRFGGPGSGAGQLKSPQSIVLQPGTGNIFVSEVGNRRISVFNSAGGFLYAFGYGVLDGADAIQTCGIDIGPCQAGVAYQVDARSYFTRLDFGPDGELFAYMPLTGQVQVFSVPGSPAPPAPPAAGGTPQGPVLALRPAAGKPQIRIAANPLKVKKGKRAKLTATINRGKDCGSRLAQFQEKRKRGWANLGKAVKPDKACRASKSVKVTAKSRFRAILIEAKGKRAVALSPPVTVKLK